MFSSAVNSACMVMLGASYGPSTVIYFDDFYMEAVNMSTEGILSHFYLYFILYYLIVSFYSFHFSNSFFFFLYLHYLPFSLRCRVGLRRCQPLVLHCHSGMSFYLSLLLFSPFISPLTSPPLPSSALYYPSSLLTLCTGYPRRLRVH